MAQWKLVKSGDKNYTIECDRDFTVRRNDAFTWRGGRRLGSTTNFVDAIDLVKADSGSKETDVRDEWTELGCQSEKRPADVIGAAVKVMKVATGEIDEDRDGDGGKDMAAQSLGRRGGQARSAKMTPERRAEIAKKAAAKRWARK